MHIINTLVEITIYSAVIFGMLLLMKRCLGKKMSPALHYALWFVLLARLVIPVTIDSGFRLFTLPSDRPVIGAPASEPQWTAPDGNLDWGALPAFTAQADPAANAVPAQAAAVPQATGKPSALRILPIVWIAGMAACGLWLAVLYAALLRRIRRNQAKPSKKLAAILEEVKAELGIHAQIRLICLYEYGTPALMFPNTVLMPVDALAAMNAEQIKFALRHELTHFRRGDHIVGLLLSVLNAVYWFNPIVWVAFHMLRSDMETACDATVTRWLTKAEKNDYACLILKLFAQPEHRQIVLGMAQNSTRKMAEQRIRGVFMRKSSKPIAKVACLVMVLVMLIGCFTTACMPVRQAAAQVGTVGGADGATDVPVAGVPTRTALQPVGRWQEAWHKDAYKVEIDAEIIAPEGLSATIPILTPRTFQTADIEHFLHIFFDGREVKNYNPTTKAEWQELLEQEQELLAALQAGSAPEYDLRPISEQITSCEERIASIEVAISSANDQEVSDAPLSLDMLPRSQYESTANFYNKDEEGNEHLMLVSQYTGVGSLVWYGDRPYEYSRVPDSEVDQDGLPNLAAAEKLAADYMAQLGISDYAPSGQSIVRQGDDYAYSFRYTRTYGAMPFLNIQAVPSGLDSTMPQESTTPIFAESISIVSDGTSIIWLEWRYPFTVTDSQELDAPILTAEQAKELAKKALDQYMTERDDPYTLTITQLRLGGCYVYGKATDSYQYIPVWDVIGFLSQEDGSRVLGDGEQPLSMVTINAMDGSIVNRERVN